MNRIYAFIVLVALSLGAAKAQNKKNSSTNILDKHPEALNFIVMGDWGRTGADHQTVVAKQMGKTASEMKAKFVIATGDNFYPKGIASKFDPLWKTSFEDIYTDFSLQNEWYPVLGNHDYLGNPEAQVEYTQISRRWNLPSRYYSKKIAIKGSDKKLLLVFIDTNPLIKEFYSNSEYGPNVATQDTSAQKKWLEEVLSDTSADIAYKMVIGHHPPYSAGKRSENYDIVAIRNSLVSVLNKYKVDAYIAGHEHSLQHLSNGSKTEYFISGSASEATPVYKNDYSKFAASEYGFLVFSVTDKNVEVQAVNEKGYVIYRYSFEL